MKLQDFKFLFIFIFCSLLLLWFSCSFFAIPYEDGTSKSLLSTYSYKVAKVILFSLNFWYQFFNTFFAFIISLLTSTVIISWCVYLIISYKNILKFIKR